MNALPATGRGSPDATLCRAAWDNLSTAGGTDMATVAITRNDDIGTAIREALSHLDLRPLVASKLVAVKPNDTWASEEDKTGVTQPDTLRAVLQQVKHFDPREVIVTGGAGAAETNDAFRIAGLMEVVEKEQAIFLDHNRLRLRREPEKDVHGP